MRASTAAGRDRGVAATLASGLGVSSRHLCVVVVNAARTQKAQVVYVYSTRADARAVASKVAASTSITRSAFFGWMPPLVYSSDGTLKLLLFG